MSGQFRASSFSVKINLLRQTPEGEKLVSLPVSFSSQNFATKEKAISETLKYYQGNERIAKIQGDSQIVFTLIEAWDENPDREIGDPLTHLTQEQFLFEHLLFLAEKQNLQKITEAAAD